MGGADTIGYFPFYGCYTDENGNRVDLDDTTRYDILKKLYASDEVTEAYNHFVDREYQIFAEKNLGSDAYWYSAYVKDGEVYVIAVNNSDSVAECNILLASDDGTVTIRDYSAEMIYGRTEATEAAEAVTGNGVLSFSLEGDGAYVWKITPSDIADFTKIKETKYKDIYSAPWAVEAIRSLEEAEGNSGQEILVDRADTSFAPLELITRGEFIEMLVNILDTGTVPSALTNIAYPEKTLSRQDMMAFIAIANGVSGAADTCTFTTKGSTTRAEAAVILWNIWESKKQ